MGIFILLLKIFITIICSIYSIYIPKLINNEKNKLSHIIILNSLISYTLLYLNLSSLFFPMQFSFVFILLHRNNKKFIITSIYTCTLFVINVLIDSLTGYMCIYLFDLSPSTLMGNNLVGLLFTVCVTVSSLIIYITVVKYFNIDRYNFKALENTRKRLYIFITLNILSITLLLYVNTLIINNFIESDSKIIVISTIILIVYFISLIITTILFIINTEKDIKFENVKREYLQLKEYTTTLENMHNDMRKFKHDYMNILSTINGYILDNNMSQLKKYFSKEIIPLSEEISTSNLRLEQLQHIKIPGLKGLLSAKILSAYTYEVDLHIDILEDIDYIHMDIVDLCRVIGILFDNAIEEISKIEQSNIKIGIIRRNLSIIIVLVNSCSKDIPPIYKMFEKGFSTKGTDRGIGLNTVKEILNRKYPNVTLNTEIQNNYLKQELTIKNEIKHKLKS